MCFPRIHSKNFTRTLEQSTPNLNSFSAVLLMPSVQMLGLCIDYSWGGAGGVRPGHGVDDRGAGVRVPVGWKNFHFSLSSSPALGSTQPLCNGYKGVFPGGKAAEREADTHLQLVPNKQKQTPWSESASELYRPRDRRLSAKWLPTFADRGCHVVTVTDPYGRILGFIDRSRYFSFK
jgi:hypothetical protein